MESLRNKNVFITGTSSGIGKACAYAFAEAGANVIISARSIDIVKDIAADLMKKFGIKAHAIKLDVRNRGEVESSVKNLPEEFKKIDILVNNAGLGRGLSKFYEDNPDGWEEMIDTNIKGLLYVTHAVIHQMVERENGHIINIGSIAGLEAYPKGSVYCATKAAVESIAKSLKMDVVDKNIRVSNIDPGMVETGFSKIRFYGDEEKAKNVYKGITPLSSEDIADAVIFVATRKPHVNISQLVIYPTAQASATVAHRV